MSFESAADEIDRLVKRFKERNSAQNAVIVGGGIAGIKTFFELREQGIPAILVEKERNLGGVWSVSRHASSYPGLVLNTHHAQMMLSDRCSVGSALPDYLTRSEYAEYVADFVEGCDAHQDIYTNCTVKTIAAAQTVGKFKLKISGSLSSSIEADVVCSTVIMCTGDTGQKIIPELQGNERFPHSSEVDLEALKTLRTVLLVEFGNTAGDYAVELAKSGVKVSISARNPTWVVPKTHNGTAIDFLVQSLQHEHGSNYGKELFREIAHKAFFSGTKHSRSVDWRTSRIVKNDALPQLLKSENVRVVGTVACVKDKTVCFSDGGSEGFDAVVFCTGYSQGSPTFEGISESGFTAGALSRSHDALYQVGMQPIWGGTAEIVARQAKLVSKSITNIVERKSLIRELDKRERNFTESVQFPDGSRIYTMWDFLRITDGLIDGTKNVLRRASR